MNAKLLEGVAGKTGERVAAAIVSPAFGFLVVGMLAWLSDRGWSAGWSDVTAWLSGRETGEGLLLTVLLLLSVLLLGNLAQALSVPMIRLLEGYWPRWWSPITRWCVGRQGKRFARRDELFQAAARAAVDAPTEEALRRMTRAEDALDRYPSGELMPTRLGNILRAAEQRPYVKYGLDPVRCWHQLWLVLPDSTRSELHAARTALDGAAVAFLFSAAVVVWAPWAWWTVVFAVVACWVCHRVYVVPAAELYGDLLEAACDVHRPALFTALRLEPGRSPQQDRAVAEFVNTYLQRGSAEAAAILRPPVQ